LRSESNPPTAPPSLVNTDAYWLSCWITALQYFLETKHMVPMALEASGGSQIHIPSRGTASSPSPLPPETGLAYSRAPSEEASSVPDPV
jgi:hypothetical protein